MNDGVLVRLTIAIRSTSDNTIRSTSDNTWLARILELGLTTEGATVDEAIEMSRHAIDGYFELCRDTGILEEVLAKLLEHEGDDPIELEEREPPAEIPVKLSQPPPRVVYQASYRIEKTEQVELQL